MQKVYLDNAASTPLRPEVIRIMQKLMQDSYGNPSSNHGFGRATKKHIETSRKNIAKRIGAHPFELVFTSGGTEGNNLILYTAIMKLGIRHVITSKIEHHSVLHTLSKLQEYFGIQLSYVSLSANGRINYDHLQELLKHSNSKTLVSLMYINNEIGTILDLDKVGLLCKSHQALFHSDMVQAIGHFEIDLSSTAIDFVTASAHKFHGPKGIGFAYVRKGLSTGPLIVGGEQERGLRGGTENCYGIVGMDTALDIAYANLVDEKKAICETKDYFVNTLSQTLPEVKFHANSDRSDQNNTYTLVNLSLPINKEKAKVLLFHLDLQGIACSKGSACQSGSATGSHVLTEILCPKELELPSLRFSFSVFNTKKEIDHVVKTLEQFAALEPIDF